MSWWQRLRQWWHGAEPVRVPPPTASPAVVTRAADGMVQLAPAAPPAARQDYAELNRLVQEIKATTPPEVAGDCGTAFRPLPQKTPAAAVAVAREETIALLALWLRSSPHQPAADLLAQALGLARAPGSVSEPLLRARLRECLRRLQYTEALDYTI